MIANNDEAKRSKIWTVVTAVTSVLIVIIAIFLLMKMFTGNPLEGSWTDEDGNMDLKIGRNGQMTVILPASLRHCFLPHTDSGRSIHLRYHHRTFHRSGFRNSYLA